MIQSSLSNIAVIFLMHLCIVTMMNNKNHLPRYFVQLSIIILVSACVITMFYLPIQYGGYFFDLRLVPLVILAIRGGWKLAIPALIITSVWRLALGGEGSIPGVLFGMILPVLFSLFFKSTMNNHLTPFSMICLFFTTWLISDIPIIIFVPDGWAVFKDIAIVRCTSYVTTAFINYLFILDTVKQTELKQKLQYYAERDSLTGLYNMRHFEETVRTYPITNNAMYIVMIDIDHFKSINDMYGHLNGDLMLKKISEVIVNQASNQEDINVVIGRYGGEEFILFMTVEKAEDMIKAVTSVHQEIENTFFYAVNKEDIINLTVSMGVARLFDCSRIYEAIELADQSLYSSKNYGRNQINYAENIS